MKKFRVLVLEVLMLFCVFGLVGCTQKTLGEIISFSDEEAPNWGITLSVKNISSTGLTLIVNQSGGALSGDLLTGELYRLAVLSGDNWILVEELPLLEEAATRGWNSIAHVITADESREFDINWEWIFGELPAGTYRLMKEISGFIESENYGTFEYWVDFTVK